MAATFVQGKLKRSGGSQISINDTFTSSVPVGDLIWVCVGWIDTGGATQTVSSVSGGTGNVYSGGTVRSLSNSLAKMQAYRVINATAGAHTITVTMSASVATDICLAIVSATGVDSSSPREDETYGTQLAVTSFNAGTLSPTAPGSLLLSMVMSGSSRTFNTPTDYTLVNTSTIRSAGVYRNAASAGSYELAWSWSGSTTSGLAIHEVYRATVTSPSTGTNNFRVRQQAMNLGIA